MPRMSVHRARPVKGKAVSPLQRFRQTGIARASAGSIIAYRHNPKSGVRQRLNDTFRNLFGLLGVGPTVWLILASVAIAVAIVEIIWC
jgi:hypothetical protein